MKYLGYIPLIFAFVIGFQSWHTSLVGLCALASTVIFMSARHLHFSFAAKQLYRFTEGGDKLVDLRFGGGRCDQCHIVKRGY